MRRGTTGFSNCNMPSRLAQPKLSESGIIGLNRQTECSVAACRCILRNGTGTRPSAKRVIPWGHLIGEFPFPIGGETMSLSFSRQDYHGVFHRPLIVVGHN